MFDVHENATSITPSVSLNYSHNDNFDKLVCDVFLLNVPFSPLQSLFTRGDNGKLGAGGTIGRNEDPGSTGGATNTKVFNDELPWILSLAKTTALLAGRLSATLVVGDCEISPHLESYSRSAAYSCWLESDLFSGGCDVSYEALMYAPVEIVSENLNSIVERPVAVRPSSDIAGAAPASRSGVLPSHKELTDFVEEVEGGYGRGGRFVAWLCEAFAPSNVGYHMLKRRAMTSRDGGALENAERAILAALLTHGGLDRDAMLFSAGLGKGDGGSAGVCTPIRALPQRFAILWKSVAEVRGELF